MENEQHNAPSGKELENRSIMTGLKQSGVPEFVFGTTLLREGKQDLRESVSAKAFRHNGQMFGYYLFTQRNSSVTKARRIFYVLAKEMFLSGVTVYCISLPNLVVALNSGDYSIEYVSAENADMVFITDFYEEDATFPLQPSDASKVRSWIKNKFEEGGAVSFLGDAAVERCVAWWPHSFLRFLAEHTISNQL